MRVFIFFIFISICIADDGVIANNLESNSNTDTSENIDVPNEEISTNDSDLTMETAPSRREIKEAVLSNESINADEKLKDDIVHFDRVTYGDAMGNIKDPFIYVDQQSEEELANIDKIQNTKLVLYAILDSKAKVNNSWVTKNDRVDGWTVTDIKNDRVELKFNTETRVLYVYTKNNKLDIK